jgi:hypothetical protein
MSSLGGSKKTEEIQAKKVINLNTCIELFGRHMSAIISVYVDQRGMK